MSLMWEYGLTIAYSYIYGDRKTFDDLKIIVETLPKWNTIGILCRLNILREQSIGNLREFNEWLAGQLLDGPEKIKVLKVIKNVKNSFFNLEQQSLFLIRMLLLSNERPASTGNFNPVALGKAMLIANDFLDKSEYENDFNSEDLIGLTLRNMNLNIHEDLKLSILRSFTLCEVICKKLIGLPDYIDLPEFFKKSFGISFKRFLFCVLSISMKWNLEIKPIKDIPPIDKELFFSRTNVTPEEQNAFFNLCSLDYEEYVNKIKNEVEDVRQSQYDVLTFKKYPIIRLNKSTCWPISMKFLSQKVGHTLYWDMHDEIKKEYGEKGTIKYTNFTGHMFAEYVAGYLLGPIYPAGQKGVRLLDKKKKAMGPEIDFLIQEGSDVVAIEIKTSRMNYETLRTGNRDLFIAALENTVLKPSRQLSAGIKAWQEKKLDTTIEYEGAQSVWPVIITYYPIPQERGIWDEIYNQMKMMKNDKLTDLERVEPLTIIDVTELEVALDIISKEGLANLLRLKHGNHPNRFLSFLHFIHRVSKTTITYHDSIQKRSADIIRVMEGEIFSKGNLGE